MLPTNLYNFNTAYPQNYSHLSETYVKKCIRGIYQIVCSHGQMKSFEDWWKTVPEDLRQKTRRGDEANKPLLNQVNYVLLHLHLAGKHDAKPTHG